jgi:hypothetical protein
MLPLRNKEPPLSEISLPFSQTLPLQLFGFSCFIWRRDFAPFEILLSNNCHTSHTNLPELDIILIIQGTVIKKREISYLNYPKCCTFTLTSACNKLPSFSGALQIGAVQNRALFIFKNLICTHL